MILHVDGLISVGKSTFVRRLKKKHKDLVIFIEPSAENPYLKDFYENLSKKKDPEIGVKIEKYLIDFRFNIYKKAIALKKKGKTVVIDGSIYKSVYFIKHTYEYSKSLNKDQYNEVKEYLMSKLKLLPLPDRVIILERSISECYESKEKRLSKNKNLKCESYVTVEYLHNLNKQINAWKDWLDRKNINISVFNWKKFGADIDNIADILKV